ncbi:SDR family oxidoreductase [Aliikangiella sp. IMCC44653]
MAKTILITGANRGIGLALCETYVARGENVIGVCRKSSEALEALNVKVISGIDVSKPEDLIKLSEAISAETIDILINNAGILRSSSFSDLNYDDIFEQFKVNAVAPLRVVEAVAPHLTSGSKVAMITSRMGSIEDNSSGGSYGYRMSKCALNAAGKSLAMDFKPRGIAVALLHPGYVSTEMVNFSGLIEPQESAQGLVARIDELNLDNSGSFWHSNGELLPW